MSTRFVDYCLLALKVRRRRFGGFGFGTTNKQKGIEMYKKCGIVSDEELKWMRKLSNDRYVCGKELNLACLFFS